MNINVIKKPVITEKSLILANQKDTYVFEVDRLANKDQIAEVIAQTFSVTVLSVRTAVSYRKKVKTGRKRLSGTKAPVKKAYVTLKKGQKIELFDIGGQA